MASVKVPSGHKNVAFGALGVGSVTLLQYLKYVPHVEVQKIDLEVGPDCCHTLAPLHQESQNIPRIWEIDPVVIYLLGGGGDWWLVQIPLSYAIMALVVGL